MPKILIIEDEAPIRRVLNKILSEENESYLVEEAEDGLMGIEKVKNHLPRVKMISSYQRQMVICKTHTKLSCSA